MTGEPANGNAQSGRGELGFGPNLAKRLDDRLFLLFGQRGDSTRNELLDLQLLDEALRFCGRPARAGRRGFVHVVEAHPVAGLAATQPIPRQIEGDLIEPRGESRFALERREAPEGLEERFLTNVLSLFFRTHHPVDCPADLALPAVHQDVEGRVLEFAGREYMVRGLGYLKSVGDIENVVVGATKQGTPIRVAQLGHVGVGPAIRRGVTDLQKREDRL
jgi:hypothetical protein